MRGEEALTWRRWAIVAVLAELLAWSIDQFSIAPRNVWIVAPTVAFFALWLNGLWIWSFQPKSPARLYTTVRRLALGAAAITLPVLIIVALRNAPERLLTVRWLAFLAPGIAESTLRAWNILSSGTASPE